MKARDHQLGNVSAGVVALLRERGMTLTQIAGLLGVTRSYVSRVKNGTRSFTLDHLVMLERKVGQPLPLLLIKATPITAVPKELRPLYRSTAKVLAASEKSARSRQKPRSAA